MGVTRNKYFSYKVFNEKDLKRLMQFVMNAKEESKEHKERNMISFRVYFEDNTSIDNDTPEVLNENKLIESAKFNFVNYLEDINIEININKNIGFFSVRGKNQDWVDAKFIQLEEIINSVKNQKKYLAAPTSQFIIASIVAFPLVLLLVYFITKFSKSDDFIIPLFFSVTLQAFFAGGCSLWLKDLHTKIEFDTALDHLNKNKMKKHSIKYLWGTFLFPVVLGAFFYILSL